MKIKEKDEMHTEKQNTRPKYPNGGQRISEIIKS